MKSIYDLTPEQLNREIAYFEQELERRSSPDRQRRARGAIQRRQEELERREKARVSA